MPTYVFLVNLTEKGKSALSEVKRHGRELMEYVETLKGTAKGSFMTLGRYDLIEIIDLPDDMAALKYSMKSTESGLKDVETLKGFTQEDALFNIP